MIGVARGVLDMIKAETIVERRTLFFSDIMVETKTILDSLVAETNSEDGHVPFKKCYYGHGHRNCGCGCRSRHTHLHKESLRFTHVRQQSRN